MRFLDHNKIATCATNLARERWGPTLLRMVAIIRVMTNWMPSTAIFTKLLLVFSLYYRCSCLTCQKSLSFTGSFPLLKEEAVISSSFPTVPLNISLNVQSYSSQPICRKIPFLSISSQKFTNGES